MELQISTQQSNFWINLPQFIRKMGRNPSRKLMILRICDVMFWIFWIILINFKMERTKTPKIHKGSLMKSQHLQSKYQKKKKICSAFFLNKSLVWTSGNSLKVKEVE